MKGFTLIEILIVIGIFTLIASIGILVNISSLQRDFLSAERSVIVSSLEKARSRSMNNLFASPHGFCYLDGNYIIFRDGAGTRCVSGIGTNEIIEANINIAGNPGSNFGSPVIFSQIAGTTTDQTIRITDGPNSYDITINYEGRIDW